MSQLTCGGLINSNTGPLGHASSNDGLLSFKICWKTGDVGIETMAGWIPSESDKWW